MKRILILILFATGTISCSGQSLGNGKKDVCVALENVVHHEQFYKLFRLDAKDEVILLDSTYIFDQCTPSLKNQAITVVKTTTSDKYVMIKSFEEINDQEVKMVMFEPGTNKLFKAFLNKKKYKITKVEAGIF